MIDYLLRLLGFFVIQVNSQTSKTMVLQRPPAGLAAVKNIQNDTILEKIEKNNLLIE